MSDPRPDREQLRELRTRNRLAAERIRAARLESIQKRAEKRAALESVLTLDWVGPYADLLNQQRRGEPDLAGPTAAWHRRAGRNYPIFQSEQELSILRAPARLLEATNDYAQRLLAGIGAYLVGTGFTHRVARRKGQEDIPDDLLAACQQLIDDFHDRTDWHGGEQPSMEAELVQRSVVDGEFFLCHFLDSETGLVDVRTVEPEQVTQPPGADQREYGFGIRTPRFDAQKHLAYWAQWGDSAADGEEVSADRMTHYRRNVKRLIKRGLTDFCFGTLDGFDLAGRLRTNLGDTAAQQAAIVGIMQHETGTADEIEAALTSDAEYAETDPVSGSQWPVRRQRKGEWQHIPKGQLYINPPTAANSPIHIQVLQACLRGAGGRWHPPEWMVSGDSSNNNYASALVADAPWVKVIQQQQPCYARAFRRTDWLVIDHWCDTHGGVVAAGRLWSKEEIHRHLDVLVSGPSPASRNRLEEAQIAAIEIPLGAESRQNYAQTQGREWDQIDADNRAWDDKHGGQGDPLPLPGELPANPLESLLECGGKGGDPGPCSRGGGSSGSGGSSVPPADAAELADLKASLPAEARSGGAWEKVQALHGKVRAAAIGAAVQLLSHAHEVYPEVLDTVDDMTRISYAKSHDALLAATGVPSSVAVALASHVIARASLYLRKKVMGESETPRPSPEELAAIVLKIMQALNEALGVDLPLPNAGEVEARIQARLQAKERA